MANTLSRCKPLLILTTWACACLALLLVWPPLPPPKPPLPATSPRPKHPPTAISLGLSHRPADMDKGRSEVRKGGRGGGGPRLFREEEEEEVQKEVKNRIMEYYIDDGDDEGRLGDDGDDGGYSEADTMERRINKNKYNKGSNNEGKGEQRNREITQSDEDEGDILGTRKEEQEQEQEEYQTQEAQEDYPEEQQYADELEYTGGQYNVTPHDARLLIYNRIPKCASSTMQTILRWCSRKLGYDHVSSLVYDQHQLSPPRQKELVNNLTIKTSTSGTLSYDQHLYYTDFAKHGAEQPVYINLVREPVERFISSFYYRRSKERLARILAHGHLIASPSPNWRNRTVEQCVLAGDPECSFSEGDKQEMILTYFCGHQPSCRMVGSKAALQQAKRVVSEEYSVVGLVGHMEVSLRLMETLIPGYLAGALRSYHNIRKKEKVNKNSHKPTVSKEVRDELRRRMAHDIDFYNFLQQRLFLQRQTFLGK